MPASKPVTNLNQAKTFEAVLERTPDRLRWVIARLPFDSAKAWGKRGQLRIKGDINGFAFSGTLFPTGSGTHFLIVNKKLLAGGKTAAGLKAKFRLQPDTTPRPAPPRAKELLRELGQSKRLLRFFESLSPSRRSEIAKWIAQCKTPEARTRRARQIAERLMETMEAERELPPILQLALRQNPRAREQWERMSQSHRRAHLFRIFYYREPEARAKQVGKVIDQMLGRKPDPGNEEDFSETV
ncbi:MAG TPA: YdeI/OmpD-associated family protein [Candidatus Angelobacter sp.]|nr:YdeI/OmpD-associated family protein [Candidatus Angelobacter sp.]